MLKLSPISRARVASGAGGVACLAVAGLALTASGSGAAMLRQQAEAAAPSSHAVRGIVVVKDGRATTIDGTSADIDARVAKGERVAIKPPVKGGKRFVVKMPDDPSSLVEIQDIPAVATAKCGIGSGEPAVMTTGTDRPRKIVVCTDRIRVLTANAMKVAMPDGNVATNAYAQALAGLLDARAKMTGETGLPEADRTRALAAIDRSIVEMRAQLDRKP